MAAKRYGTEAGVREILLTFDDGPHPTLTPKLLDVLAKHNVKAMFFVLGSKLGASAGRKIIERAHKDGHQVGNHTFNHIDLKKLSEPQIRDELKKTQDLIGAYGHPLRFFRPPYGSKNSLVDRILREENYTNVMWSVDPQDWKPPKTTAWVRRALDGIKAREDSLLVMHDIHSTTVDNVESLILAIKQIPHTQFVLYT